MMQGLMWAVIAGSLVSLQNIFNSKVNERAGTWVTTTIVLGMGFAASFLLGLLMEGGGMFRLHDMKTWYWFSGLIGVGVVTCMVQGIKRLGPTYAISIGLTAQLGFALLMDTNGWLGLTKIAFTPKHLIGVLVIVCGILVFKLGDRREGKAHEVQAESVR